jgi:hypothetical protein
MLSFYSIFWMGYTLDGGVTEECPLPYGVVCLQE